MQNKLKIGVGAGITTIVALTIRKAIHQRVGQHIYQQINRQFPHQQIYGTWLYHKLHLWSHNYYLGGINVSNGEWLTEYQFSADQHGNLTALTKTTVRKLKRF